MLHAGPEVCTANPEECQVDRISELNEDGECQYHCAEGLAGDICTSKFIKVLMVKSVVRINFTL